MNLISKGHCWSWVFYFFVDNINVGHLSTLQCAFIMVKLIKIRGVRCLEFFLKTMTPLLWGAISWACFNQRNQSKR